MTLGLPIKQNHKNPFKPSKKQLHFYGRISHQQGTWKELLCGFWWMIFLKFMPSYETSFFMGLLLLITFYTV
jgi:hypothetical protein